MDNNNISERLKALSQGKNRSATAQLREIFNEIEATLRSGVRRKNVHQVLVESGFKITFESFELAIYRIRKEGSKYKKHTALPSPTGAPAAPQTEELARPPGLTPAAWSEMQQKHKTEQRRLKNLNGE